jgi:hypothetical protein
MIFTITNYINISFYPSNVMVTFSAHYSDVGRPAKSVVKKPQVQIPHPSLLFAYATFCFVIGSFWVQLVAAFCREMLSVLSCAFCCV